MKERQVVLLDGDILAYKTACVQEKSVDWGDGVHTLSADAGEGAQQIDSDLAFVKQKTKADAIVIALSDSAKFRQAVLPTYKSNRTARKPIILAAMRQHLLDKHAAWVRPALEADDVIGILATANPGPIKGKLLIHSIDKDFLTIPGWHLDTKDLTKPAVYVSEQDADLCFFAQVLTGDQTDGYKGCPGVGPKSAEAILTAALSVPGETYGDVQRSLWSAIVAAYAKKGLTEADALVQARCARILRATDYNFEKKEPILWEPLKSS